MEGAEKGKINEVKVAMRTGRSLFKKGTFPPGGEVEVVGSSGSMPLQVTQSR